MTSAITTKELALHTLKLETQAIESLYSIIDEEFEKIIDNIYASKGRLIISGIGKSAIVAQKMVATLNSTGTPSIFLHAADAIHGDLGMVLKDDIVCLISKSGNSPEIQNLMPILDRMPNHVIAITNKKESTLYHYADSRILIPHTPEADPNNLAPTSSTISHIAIGDVIAVCLIKKRGFSSSQFAQNHPGGQLGKQLLLRLSDLIKDQDKPSVYLDASIQEVIHEISSKRLGATAVINDQEQILGVITDGDLRRMLSKHQNIQELTASDIMTADPIQVSPDMLAAEALSLLNQKNITTLLVSDKEKYIGIVHIHDILREGIQV